MASESESEITTLDYIEKITVPGDNFSHPANEYWALICLRDRMEFLYRQALRADDTVNSRSPNGVQFWASGSFPAFDGLPRALLTCSFHWYAVSACNYVRTVGAIAERRDPSRPKPLEYAKAIIPEVVAFRNKVAAHFAWSTKHNEDNDAERLASVLPPLTFEVDTFCVGATQVGLSGGGQSSNSSKIGMWSLRKVHEALRERYWPYLIPRTDDSGQTRPPTD
jgi:hypothetical protein